MKRIRWGCAVSAIALVAGPPAFAQTVADQSSGSIDNPVDDSTPVEPDIVVTGIRSSLEKAAEIKRNAVQVVDSVVAEDISKFPDPTVASALQRVPGVQVSNDRNNELSGVRIRGLTDILTTVDDREVFTTTGRNFDLQDIAADALGRIDVYKSQTADLIEGGVAGVVNLKLNKPFNFRDPAISVSARGNYGKQVDRINPQIGVLATDRWDTGIGEIGALISGSWSDAESLRINSNLTDRRNSGANPLRTPGYFIPNILQNATNEASVKRVQLNAALQWQASPELEIFLDGLYTKVENTDISYGFNVQPFTTNVSASDIEADSNCFDVRSTNGGQNPTIQSGVEGDTLQPFTVANLCNVTKVTLHDAVANNSTGVDTIDQRNKLIAGGFRFDDSQGVRLTFDTAYQSSANDHQNIRTAVGQRFPELILETDVGGGSRITVPGADLTDPSRLSFRNQLIQDFGNARGGLFQSRVDGEQELDGFISALQFGLRYADRSATFKGVHINTPLPFGNIGTGSEANAKLVSDTSLYPDFIGLSAEHPRLNGGARFAGPNGDFMLSEDGLNALRNLYNLPSGRPADDALEQFDASEKTYASYAQVKYEVDIAPDILLDGVVGLRATKTVRTVDTFDDAGAPLHKRTSDTDLLPNATARLRLPGRFQARLSYSKAIRRPEFALLNPAQTLVVDVNPAQLSTGSAGNPDLLPQESKSFDATLEHYWKSGFVAVTGYRRDITNRVITAGAQEVIDGVTYIISRPRNVGEAKLQGIEISGQNFFDFLPGAFSGLGALGAFTYADSEVRGGDSLAGNPLEGVSKYNFTVGLLYEKFGLSGRVVYTYRSKYYTNDLTGQPQLRPFDPSLPNQVYVPTLLEYVRPAGRLDFSLGYDITDNLRLDIGGTNILRSRTRTYRGESYFIGNYFYDETTYTAGVRYRF